MLKVDVHHLQDKMRAPWEAGDFGAIARTIGAPEAESFAARLKIDPGAKDEYFAEISSLELPKDMERLQEISRFYRYEYLSPNSTKTVLPSALS